MQSSLYIFIHANHWLIRLPVFGLSYLMGDTVSSTGYLCQTKTLLNSKIERYQSFVVKIDSKSSAPTAFKPICVDAVHKVQLATVWAVCTLRKQTNTGVLLTELSLHSFNLVLACLIFDMLFSFAAAKAKAASCIICQC